MDLLSGGITCYLRVLKNIIIYLRWWTFILFLLLYLIIWVLVDGTIQPCAVGYGKIKFTFQSQGIKTSFCSVPVTVVKTLELEKVKWREKPQFDMSLLIHKPIMCWKDISMRPSICRKWPHDNRLSPCEEFMYRLSLDMFLIISSWSMEYMTLGWQNSNRHKSL